jgi:hypothetical protein
MGAMHRNYCCVGQIAKLNINMHKYYNALWHQFVLADVALPHQNAPVVQSSERH